MYKGYDFFPKDKDELSCSLTEAIQAAELERNIQSIDWYITHYYLQGVRKFFVRSWERGDVSIAWENSRGSIDFRCEKILELYRIELGRLMKVDVNPTTMLKGCGLDGVRKAGAGKAVLTTMVAGVDLPKLYLEFCQLLLKFGTAGLYHWRCPGHNVADRTCVELVPPWEILSIPADTEITSSVKCLVRKKRTTLDWLLSMRKSPENPNGLSFPLDEKRLRVREVAYGDSSASMATGSRHLNGPLGSWRGGPMGSVGGSIENVSKPKEKSKRSPSGTRLVKYIDPEEVFVLGPKGGVVRQILKVGEVIVRDERYDDPIPCPLTIARYTPTGRLYGRSFVGPLLSINDRVEKMLENQFQNAIDIDNYGMIVAESTAGLNKRAVEERQKRKVLFVQPNPMSRQQKPVYAIEPFNSGDFPAKISGLAIALMEKLANQGEMLQGGAPGRTESAASLGLLYETGNVSLTPTVNEIANAFSGIYKSMLSSAKRELMTDKEFPLPILDLDMIGLSLTPTESSVGVENNPIPEPDEVVVTIKDRNTSSGEQRRQEALTLMEMGINTPVDFQILNFQEGMNYPVQTRIKYNAWRKAVLQAILLFNDGMKPGPFFVANQFGRLDSNTLLPDNYADDPQITLEVIQHVMATPEFMFTSREIMTAFTNWKLQMERTLGQSIPQPMMGAPEMADGMAGPPPMEGAVPPGAGPIT